MSLRDDEIREIEESATNRARAIMGDRRSKDGMTKWHQYITVLGVPMIMAALGWLWLQFDGLRLDMRGMQGDVAHISQRMDAQGDAIKSLYDHLIEGKK